MAFDQKKYKRDFEKEKYAVLKIRIPKAKRGLLDELSEISGKSINRIFVESVEKNYNVDLRFDFDEIFSDMET